MPTRGHGEDRQPVVQLEQRARRRAEAPRVLGASAAPIGHADARGDRVLVHVEPGAAFDEPIHGSSSILLVRRSLIAKSLNLVLAATVKGAEAPTSH
jgi:hypothetical protein